MADIRYFNHTTKMQVGLDFGALVTIIKGSSITSLALSETYIEFGLSDAFNLRIDIGSAITIIPTTNEGDVPPVRLSIIADDETPTAELVESRIHALRQIYAINFLIDVGREDDLVKAFLIESPFDLEDLIAEDDKLLIKSASTGSFWLTLAAKSAAAWRSLTGIAPLFFEEGRQAILERVRASTELTKLDVKKKAFDIEYQKANAIVDLYNKIEKIKDNDVKNKLKEKLEKSFDTTGESTPTLPYQKI